MTRTRFKAADGGNRLKLFLTIGALACLAAGLGIALLALAGPVGVWIGIADFRRGFEFLRIVDAWADRIAWMTLVGAIGVAVVARLKSIGNVTLLSGLALVGTVSAAIAWYVPQTFRPPANTPPIHDIATDPDRPLQFEAIAPLRADAPNSMEYGAGQDMTAQRLKELTQQAYPDLVPQRFNDSVEDVFGRALAAVSALGWEIVSADPDRGRIEATDTTFWFRFKDDIVIHVADEGGQAVLNARSLSRVGVSDVGKNAARLRELFALL